MSSGKKINHKLSHPEVFADHTATRKIRGKREHLIRGKRDTKIRRGHETELKRREPVALCHIFSHLVYREVFLSFSNRQQRNYDFPKLKLH